MYNNCGPAANQKIKGCHPRGCRGCHGTPRFWQISEPYLNRGGGGVRFCPPITTHPFRLSDLLPYLRSCQPCISFYISNLRGLTTKFEPKYVTFEYVQKLFRMKSFSFFLTFQICSEIFLF